MPTVWLIRHGESQSNAGYATGSSELTQLTGVGKTQAEQIVKAFTSRSYKPALIATSKYMRSRQTAQPTIDEFWNNSRQIRWPVYEFTYLSNKKSAGTTQQERRSMAQEFWDRCKPDYIDGEGAESFRQFMGRVYDVLERLRYSEEDFIAVFTHGQFIKAILWLLQTSPASMDAGAMKHFRHFCQEYPIPTGAIQEIELWGREDFHIGELITDHLNEGKLPWQRLESDNTSYSEQETLLVLAI